MRKALVPMLASLALCGAATAALVATNARAAPTTTRKPVMVALVTPGTMLAQTPSAFTAGLTGSYAFGFVVFAGLALAAWGGINAVRLRWRREASDLAFVRI